MNLNLKFKKSDIDLIWKSILLFFFIYDVALQGISTKFSSRKIVFIIFSLIFLYKYFKCDRKIIAPKKVIEFYTAEFVVCVFSLLHVFIRALIYGFEQSIYVEYPYVVYFLLFGLLAPICIVSSFRDIEEFLKALILATVYQSVFVILEFWIWPMRIWLSEHIYTTANVLYTHAKRATGLGASGAQLSVWLFFGVFACSYFLIRKQKHRKYWGIILIIFMAQFLSGRTGLYLGIVDVLIVGVALHKNRKVLLNTMVKIGIIGIIVLAMVVGGIHIGNIAVTGRASVLTEAINRNTSISRIVGENGFFARLAEDTIPPLNKDTLLGYGVVGGQLTQELSCWHDSGFVKRYVADGLVMAIVEYVFFCLLLFNLWETIKYKTVKKYTFALIPVLLLIEIKEPFMYYYSGAALTLCILILASKQHRLIVSGNKKV